jgi:uncharacterized membrane protein
MNEKRSDIIIGRTFAMLSALGYAVGAVLNRQGLTHLTSPLVGSLVSTLSGTLVLGLIAGRRLESNLWNRKTHILFFFLAGIGSSIGALCSFFALSMAPVVIVNPINNTYPLFALFFSRLFLSRLEKISLRLVAGTIFVVGGVTLITIGKGV